MKRSAAAGKLFFQVAAVAIVLASLVTVVVTAGLAWLTFGDLTREYQSERLVPHVNLDKLTKATDILRKKEVSKQIDLKIREVKFGRTEPFEQ